MTETIENKRFFTEHFASCQKENKPTQFGIEFQRIQTAVYQLLKYNTYQNSRTNLNSLPDPYKIPMQSTPGQ